MTRFLNLNKP